MTVLVSKSLPASVRGSLRKWMIEVEPGVFLGELSVRVREELMNWLVPQMDGGTALLIFRDNSSQTGYKIITLTPEKCRRIKVVSGIPLVEISHPKSSSSKVESSETPNSQPF